MEGAALELKDSRVCRAGWEQGSLQGGHEITYEGTQALRIHLRPPCTDIPLSPLPRHAGWQWHRPGGAEGRGARAVSVKCIDLGHYENIFIADISALR